ncbi:hypothetical protein BXU11_16205 [Flavobacterium sp. LM5]|nr:hypothetical protein BXU11_16205 [Flavobacterium sp. LM5]
MLCGGCFVEITIKTQIFQASVGKIQFSRFCFLVCSFQLVIVYLSFKFWLFFGFPLADSNFHSFSR